MESLRVKPPPLNALKPSPSPSPPPTFRYIFLKKKDADIVHNIVQEYKKYDQCTEITKIQHWYKASTD